MTIIDLTKMREDEVGVIKEVHSASSKKCGVHGANGFAERIAAMGIRPGKKIKKISSSFLRGPQTIEIGKMQVAIGFGAAKKILVEVNRSEHK